MAMPIRSATRMTSSPLAAVTSTPSTTSVTMSVFLATSVISVRSYQGLLGQPRSGPALDVVQVVLAEELQRRHDRRRGAVAQAAERAAEDVVGGVLEGVQVLDGALAGQDPAVRAHHPVVALAARSALAAGLVVVEL